MYFWYEIGNGGYNLLHVSVPLLVCFSLILSVSLSLWLFLSFSLCMCAYVFVCVCVYKKKSKRDMTWKKDFKIFSFIKN